MSKLPLIVETRGPVAIWRLNNPEIRHPLTAELKAALAEAAVRSRMKSTHAWMKLLVASEKPAIMAVNGAAVGAGTSLALVGDIVVASDRAYFMSGFPKVGVLPDCAFLYNLPRAIGLPAAKDFLMTNRRIDAETALKMGLISRVFPHDGLLDGAIAIAQEIAEG